LFLRTLSQHRSSCRGTRNCLARVCPVREPGRSAPSRPDAGKLAARFLRETVISFSFDHPADCTTQGGAQMRIALLALLRRCCARRRLNARRFLGRPLPSPLTCRCEGIAISSGMSWRVCQVTDSIFLIAICSKRTAQGLPPSPDANSRAASIEKTKARLVV
jgi:hypothetical protein